VSYTPRDSGQDADTLIVINNDPKEDNRVEIPISGGATPRIRVDPPDTLVFPIGSTPGPRREQLRISNVGYGDLVVQRMTITGPSGDTDHPSRDDFTFADGCANPCDRLVTLCPPSNTSCTNNQIAVAIDYENNDISTVDFAELHIASTDPANPEHILVLSAEDQPCFYPTPVITVETTTPCKGMPVTVHAMMSQPGGSGGSGAAIVSYEWQWLFTPAAAPVFSPNGMVSTTFVPSDGGVYVLALDVKNDCGGESQAPASETLLVAETCN